MASNGEGERLHGWLVIDKPVGPGSTEVVTAVKRALRDGGYARAKVGHGGTLDPLASGVLPVALGEATKLAGRMLIANKIYDFTIAFGAETDTLDLEGEVVAQSPVRPSVGAMVAVLGRFIGEIEQLPPAYSALKVDGKRAYARARAGEAVTMTARRVTVHALCLRHLREGRNDEDRLDQITLTARVSKGTYIRSLARDIAHALGTVGHVAMLRRTHVGPFTFAAAISLDKLRELAHAHRLEQALLPLTAGLDDIPALTVTPDQARSLREGRKLVGTAAKPGLNLAMLDAVPVALVELSEDQLRVVRGFNL